MIEIMQKKLLPRKDLVPLRLRGVRNTAPGLIRARYHVDVIPGAVYRHLVSGELFLVVKTSIFGLHLSSIGRSWPPLMVATESSFCFAGIPQPESQSFPQSIRDAFQKGMNDRPRWMKFLKWAHSLHLFMMHDLSKMSKTEELP